MITITDAQAIDRLRFGGQSGFGAAQVHPYAAQVAGKPPDARPSNMG